MNELSRTSLVIFTGAFVAATIGCGGSGLPMVPVNGTVTFDGGPPPDTGMISFTPAESSAGMPQRAAVARFDKEGEYTVTSFNPEDGLLPGTYTVKVSCYSGAPKIGSADPYGDVSYIDKSYQPATLVVESDSDPIEANFDVPLKKK